MKNQSNKQVKTFKQKVYKKRVKKFMDTFFNENYKLLSKLAHE